MCIILFLLSNVSTSYSHPTAAILKHHRLLSTPQSTKTKKIRKYISHLELRTCCSNTHRPYSPAVATSRLHPAPLRVQVWRRARRGCKRVFLLFFFNSRYSAPAFTTPLLFEENTAYILHTHAVVCESLRRPSLQHREEASSSGDGDQVSCRRLERSVFMAAAGRDVSLAPSIQLPSDGFSPCFIIIPIISRGGGPRLPPLLLPLSSCPLRPSHSPFLASHAI